MALRALVDGDKNVAAPWAFLGASVEVRQPGTDRLLGMRGIYSNQGYKSSSALEPHFGLGKTARVNLQVRLPGGRKVKVADVAADRYLDLNLKGGAVREGAVKVAAPVPAARQP